MKSIFKTFLLSLLVAAQVHFAYAQTASILPPAKSIFIDKNGKPLTSGTVDFYIPGTTTRNTTWQDAAETTPNTNPVVLDGSGGALILGSGNYRQVVKDRFGNLIWDQVTSSAGSGGTTPTSVGDGAAVGSIKIWSGTTPPTNYLFTYGQEVSRATYAVLFSILTSSQAAFCSSGSPILTGLTDTTNFWIGMSVELSCVTAGQTTIIAKSSTTVTLAVNSIISLNTTATFFMWGNGDGSTSFNLPDYRGIIPVGNNNMGGVASSNLSTTYFGPATPNANGAAGGSQSVTLAQTNLPNVSFTNSGIAVTAISTPSLNFQTANTPGGSLSFQLSGAGSGTGAPAGLTITTTPTVSAQGSAASGGNGTPIGIIPPSKTANFAIKVLPDNSLSTNVVTSIGGMIGDIICGIGLTCSGQTILVNNSIVIPPPTSAILGGVFSDTCGTSNWFNSLSTAGSFTCLQPNFTDLAGSLAVTQIPTNLITNAKLAQTGAATLKGNPTSGTANAQDFTIQGLSNSAPNATLDYFIYYNHTTGTFESATASQISTAVGSGVTSLGGLTGAITCGFGLTCSGSSIIVNSTVGCLNILAYGGNGNGSTANDTAVSSAYSALSSGGGCIYFPTGTYAFTSQINRTLPAVSHYSIKLIGDGSGATILYWPNANGGMEFFKNSVDTSVHIRDMALITSQVNSGNAILLYGVGFNQPYGPQSDIQDVIIKGADFANSSGSECFAYGIYDDDWSALFIKNVNTYGTWGTPGSSGCGIGLYVTGDVASTNYIIDINIVSSAFNYHSYGIELASYWQGFTCVLCNFNGEEGSAGIYVSSGQSGTLAGFWVTASQFNTGGSQILFGTAVSSGAIIGSTITTYTASSNGIIMLGGEWGINGNVFNSNANGSSQAGIVVNSGSANGSITGNSFTNLNDGVVLEPGSSIWTVGLNSYNSVTTKVSNAGTNNSVGTASIGNMTGVVP